MLPRTFKTTLPVLLSRQHVRFYSKVTISNYDSKLIDYVHMEKTIDITRKRLGRSLTLTEKLLYGHQQYNTDNKEYLKVLPDRVACQDATAPMTLLQFMNTGLSQVAIPTTVHCDHQVETQYHNRNRPLADLGHAQSLLHHEVDTFLQSACETYGIRLWRPGSGILHQMVLEKYAYPGALIIGTDTRMSHAGGLATLAFPVGGAEALDAMIGLPWELKYPRILGVHLKGSLSSWANPKDVILKISTLLDNKGVDKNTIIEYMGNGIDTLSCTGMATICNMGTEIGAMSSVFPFNDNMDAYLRATSRNNIADLAQTIRPQLLEADEHAIYDHIIDLDLTTLEPHIYGPFMPDIATPISKFKHITKQHQEEWSMNISAAHIGSCTNSSYQDLARSASLVQQALERGLSFKSPVSVTPGSTQIRATLDRDGATKSFKDAGASLLANACGPCIDWNEDRPQHVAIEFDHPDHHHHHQVHDPVSIISSYNQNSTGRLNGRPNTHHFITSPEIVTAMAVANSLQFNPLTDSLIGKDGKPFKFRAPHDASKDGIPTHGFVKNDDEERARFYQAPLENNNKKKIDPNTLIPPQSTRLQKLLPFTPSFRINDNTPFVIPILFKSKGVCTAEHISMTGPWLKYRAHLDNLSNNLLIGAINAENGKQNWIKNRLTGQYDGISQTARHYKQHGIPWVLIADENYGHGSASEHGALESRYLNGVAIIAKSFAPVHEINLKKQGILPLQFTSPSDYDKVDGHASVSIDIRQLTPGKPLQVKVIQPSSVGDTTIVLDLVHSLNHEHIEWFKAGSALNYIKSRIQTQTESEETVQKA
ncbi:aconitate hydratase [Halteromyces radiatus]|uniref:aconitate hydratase n=1 Tax=Halteromyces radiatus TaxID=101107 RepID=UPI0022207F26|nr:aconitate hydratase [Halteromyces radiatus]KAI8081351.1 aconitate hydratase [Halteromyces radiatus]